MQQPRSLEERCSLTATELKQQHRSREGEDEEERRMRKTGRMPIYKGISEQAGAKIEEDPNNGYPTKQPPRFSKVIKDEDPLRDDVIKVFCVFKR